ncbi:hypothetical protein Tco_1525336 [Tanacetum coccineum]
MPQMKHIEYSNDSYCYRKTQLKGTQDNRRRDAWNSGNKDGSRTVQKEDSKALVTIDGEGVDWTNHSEEIEESKTSSYRQKVNEVEC